MEIYFALYRSKAKCHLNADIVGSIVRTSIRNNKRDGLTGFLHTDQDHFLQYLEGPQDPLMHRLSVIQRDLKHYNFMILADGTIDERLFPDWDMGQIKFLQPQHQNSAIDTGWMRPNPDVDAVPLLSAFAAHALQGEHVTITAIS
ncbi:MAG: BLUF domain-containing protein [Planktotalea sp.]|uniref:BLUF domain-containing protein n=1 Tax=Planktotalea sp. TaxID=2029877 RepID=UPI003C72FACA